MGRKSGAKNLLKKGSTFHPGQGHQPLSFMASLIPLSPPLILNNYLILLVFLFQNYVKRQKVHLDYLKQTKGFLILTRSPKAPQKCIV